jgi:hypothetical protein
MYLPAGHDARIAGPDPFIGIDFIGLADYARSK